MAILLSFHRARQVCHVESLHPPGIPVTAAIIRKEVKETRCISNGFDLVNDGRESGITSRGPVLSVTWYRAACRPGRSPE